MPILLLSHLLLIFTPASDGPNLVANRGKGSYTIEFYEETKFNGSYRGNEDYVFPGQMIYLGVNSLGEMYVADFINKRVLQFSEDGELLNVVTRDGQGPGEIQYLGGFQVLEDDRMFLLNREGATTWADFFNASHEFVQRERLNRPEFGVNQIKISPDGKLIAAEFRKTDNVKKTIVLKTGLFDREMNLLRQVSATKHTRAGNFVPDPQFWQAFFAYIGELSLADKGMLAFDSQSNVYIATRRKYEILKLDSSFEPTLKIQREVKPTLFTEAEVDRFAEQVLDVYRTNLPEQFKPFATEQNVKKGLSKSGLDDLIKPYIWNLIIMEDGHILAIVEDDQINRTQTVDIFDKHGKYLGDATLPNYAFMGEDGNSRMIFKNGKAYTILSEPEYNWVVRYSYRVVPKQ